MKPVEFDDLVRMPFLRRYEEAFQKAIGVVLKLVPPDEPMRCVNCSHGSNEFCALVCDVASGSEACRESQKLVVGNAAKSLVAQQANCFAGLMEVAVPVVIHGRHVATLMIGQVFCHEPAPRDFETAAKLLGKGRDIGWKKKARMAYFKTPVVPEEKFHAIVELLSMFAVHIADDASRHAIASMDKEPRAVKSAKKFVQTHSEEPITLKQVLKHAHASRFHFCKLFKKSTGITLTEYVARVRVEKAKALLAHHSLRITEIVFAAGFGSVPQFNSVFKRCVGMPPSAYRAWLRVQPAG